MGGDVSDGVGGDKGVAAGLLLRQAGQRATEVEQYETTPRELSDFLKGPVNIFDEDHEEAAEAEEQEARDVLYKELSEKQAKCPGEEEKAAVAGDDAWDDKEFNQLFDLFQEDDQKEL